MSYLALQQFTQTIDKLTAVYLALRGDVTSVGFPTAAGYGSTLILGSGGSDLSDTADYGAGLKARQLVALIAGVPSTVYSGYPGFLDGDVAAALLGGATALRDTMNRQNIANRFSQVIQNIASECRRGGATPYVNPATTTGSAAPTTPVVDIDTWCTHFNIGAGSSISSTRKWRSLLHPATRELMTTLNASALSAWNTAYPVTFGSASPILPQGLGTWTFGGSFTVPTNGAALLYPLVQNTAYKVGGGSNSALVSGAASFTQGSTYIGIDASQYAGTQPYMRVTTTITGGTPVFTIAGLWRRQTDGALLYGTSGNITLASLTAGAGSETAITPPSSDANDALMMLLQCTNITLASGAWSAGTVQVIGRTPFSGTAGTAFMLGSDFTNTFTRTDVPQ